jgi:hypothetical protein
MACMWRAEAELGRGLWELTRAFAARNCQLNCCVGDWDTWVVSDDGFYDCTRQMPSGHEHLLCD